MEPVSLSDLIEAARLKTPEQVERFHELRRKSFQFAKDVYASRESSYNADHESVQEMVFGPVSLASELYKRMARMAGLLTPLRTEPLKELDLVRLVDLCIDSINYASWQYALLVGAITDLEKTDVYCSNDAAPIIEAAPELLFAAKEARAFLLNAAPHDPWWQPTMDLLDSAIAKAEPPAP